MSISVKVSGVWHNVTNFGVKVAGAWKTTTSNVTFLKNVANITNATGTGTVITFTLNNTIISKNNSITVAGVNPTAYNGTYTVTGVTTTGTMQSTITVAGSATATYVSGGTASTWKQLLPTLVYTVTDAFNRTNTTTGLGTTDTGGQSWLAKRGNWFISSNQAKSTDTPSTYPVAAVEMIDANVQINLDVDTAGGGTGAAFWVSDANNWWGVQTYNASTTAYASVCSAYSTACATYTTSGASYYCASYSSRCGSYTATSVCSAYTATQVCTAYTSTYSGGLCNGTGYSSYCLTYGGTPYYSYCATYGSFSYCGSYYATYGSACSTYAPGAPSCSSYTSGSACASYYTVCNSAGPIYSSVCSAYSSVCATYTSSSSTVLGTRYLRLIKSVANTVTVVLDTAVASLVSSIQVGISGVGLTLRAYSSPGQNTQIGTDITYTATGATTATQHGLLLAPGGFDQGTVVDNLTINPN